MILKQKLQHEIATQTKTFKHTDTHTHKKNRWKKKYIVMIAETFFVLNF